MILPALLASLAAVAPPCTRVVLPTQGEASESLRTAVAEALARGLQEGSRCRVLSPGDVAAVLTNESTRQLCGLDETSCLAELGEAMGADEVVAATLSEHDDGVTLEARALAPSTVPVLARTGAHVTSGSREVVAAAEDAGRELESALEPAGWGGPLVAAGVVVTSASLAAAGLALAAWWWSSTTLAAPSATRDDKDLALAATPLAWTGAVVAAAGASLGAAVVVTGAMME